MNTKAHVSLYDSHWYLTQSPSIPSICNIILFSTNLYTFISFYLILTNVLFFLPSPPTDTHPTNPRYPAQTPHFTPPLSWVPCPLRQTGPEATRTPRPGSGGRWTRSTPPCLLPWTLGPSPRTRDCGPWHSQWNSPRWRFKDGSKTF